MPNGIDREIGELHGLVKGMSKQLDTVHIKVDKILQGECPQGQTNKQEIDKLGIRVGKVEMTIIKAIAIGLLTAGGGAGAVKLLVELVSS